MTHAATLAALYSKYIIFGNHAASDYFPVIKSLVRLRNETALEVEKQFWQRAIDTVYSLIADELVTNLGSPVNPVSFGTSGWRGIIGKDFFVKSVTQVTRAIIALYDELAVNSELAGALGVANRAEARRRGCVLGYDNRFGGRLLADHVSDTLTAHGFSVYFAGESSTGVLSAAVLELQAAFSINLTPSHNPLEYAGFKFNAADAGPAAQIITDRITRKAREIMTLDQPYAVQPKPKLRKTINSLDLWIDLVRRNQDDHGLDHIEIIERFAGDKDICVAIDCVHGVSRVHIQSLFYNTATDRLLLFRNTADCTFGGVSPEPSSANLKLVKAALAARPEPLKLGMILDPDADRIRFMDEGGEISMNQFGAMAYHFLHEIRQKNGMVAKTVATSNFANALAKAFGEEIFEPRVGFKEFKPVINRALVCFEESDGITVIGHTPEKDAYIGLLLALDMVMTLRKNLTEYLAELSEKYGHYYPDRDGVSVSRQGAELHKALAGLDRYSVGSIVQVGGIPKTIVDLITIDGRKMILDDGSWIMIRPSGTEPKVRFYVEARNDADRKTLLAAARAMLQEVGLLADS